MIEQFPVDAESALTTPLALKAQKAEAEAELKKCLEMPAQAEASLVKDREIPDGDKDKHKHIATPRSGRVYELSGPQGFDADGQHVWQRWKHINDVKSERDVTEDVWAQFLSETDEPQARAVG